MISFIFKFLVFLTATFALEEGAQEKFLDGLASLVRTGRETVTMTEQQKLTETFTSIVRVTETTIDYRTKTLSSTYSTTNSIILSFTTDTTRVSTTTETVTSTRTDEIIYRTSTTLTEAQDVILDLHIQTSLLPARYVTETFTATQSIIGTVSSLRTQVITLLHEATQTFTQSQVDTETQWTTITVRSTAVFEELVRKPRIKTVTSTRYVGVDVTVTSTTTTYARRQHYARIPGSRK